MEVVCRAEVESRAGRGDFCFQVRRVDTLCRRNLHGGKAEPHKHCEWVGRSALFC